MTGHLPSGWTVTPPPDAAGAAQPAPLPDGWTVSPPPAPPPVQSWERMGNDLRGIRDYAAETAKNIPGSALEFGKSLIQPFVDPVGTVTGIRDLVAGTIQKTADKGRERVPEMAARYAEVRPPQPGDRIDTGTVDAFTKHMVERYGGKDNILKTVKQDPVGALTDASSLLLGGGATTGIRALSTAGKAIDPINAAAKTVAATAKAVEPVVSGVVGMTTGAGGTAIREAAKAGFEGGEQQRAFLDQMRRNAPVTDVLDSARTAVEELRAQRADAYQKSMTGITKDPAILDFGPIDDAVSRVQSTGTYEGKVVNAPAAKVWQEIGEAIADWKTSDPAKFHSVAGMDALKRKIGIIRDSTEVGSPQRKAADEVYRAVRDQIVKQAPDYGKTMKEYEMASEAIQDLERSLSLSSKFGIDTSVRKLQSIMRNNVNANYGRRAELGEKLVDAGADTLMPQLAGQSLNSGMPRGLVGQGAGLAALGSGYLFNPWAVAGAPFASPRLIGEAAHLGGVAARKGGAVADYLNRLPIDPTLARVLAYQAGNATRER